jgi:hypothetical protein
MDDKKKLIVVGALVVVIGSVGAFELLGGSSAPPAIPSKKDGKVKSGKADDAVKAPVLKNPEVANALPLRNPFEPPADAQPAITKMPQMQHPQPIAGKIRGFDSPKGFQPLPAGDLKQFSSLPTSIAAPHPEQKAEDEKPFGYKVVGLIGGVRPAAMVEDSAGNQKLVLVGSAIDGDSRVKGVESDTVTIEYRGKTLRLVVGGNPGGK